MASSETELLARCKRGEPEAWDELFDAHYPAASRFVFQLGRDLSPEDVEEVCQEVFLSVVKHLRDFQGGCQFQTWLFRIAVNKARDYREKQLALKRGRGKTTISLQSEDPETGLCLDVAAAGPAPDSSMLNSERALLIGKALDDLGDPCREIIQLRYFGDLSYEEISSTLQINVKTVSSRLSKCLDQLENIARKYFSEGETAAFPSNS